MTNAKSFLLSRTLWSNAIGLAALALSAAGLDGASIDANQTADAVLQAVAALSFLASTAFRLVARKRLAA